MIKIIIFFLLFQITLNCFGQSNCFNKNDTLFWSEIVLLKWDDFHGFPENNHIAAVSSIGYIFFYNLDSITKTLTINLETYLDRRKSWVVDQFKNQILLDHEQIHFDLAELLLRKIRKIILTTELDYKNYSSILNNLDEQLNRELNLMHKKYDKETNFGNDEQGQIFWYKKVQTELIELKKYSNPIIHIKLIK